MTPHCDLDLEDRNPTFTHDTPGYDDALSYQVWLHTVQWFERKLISEDLTPHCDLDLEIRNPTFSHDTPGHDDAPSHQVWLHTVQKISVGQRSETRTT